jgi:hypothetical protein
MLYFEPRNKKAPFSQACRQAEAGENDVIVSFLIITRGAETVNRYFDKVQWGYGKR